MPPSPDFRDFQLIWQPRIAAEIYAYTGDRTAATEIAQSVFAQAASRWDRLEREEDPIRWARRQAWQRVDDRSTTPDEDVPTVVAVLAGFAPDIRRTLALLIAEVPPSEYVALGAAAIPAAAWDQALEVLSTALPRRDPTAVFAELCTGWDVVPIGLEQRRRPVAVTRAVLATGLVAVLVVGTVLAVRWTAAPAVTAAPDPTASPSGPPAWPSPGESAAPSPSLTPSAAGASPVPVPSSSPPRPAPSRGGTSPRPATSPAKPPAPPPPPPPCQASVSVTGIVDGSGGVTFTAKAVDGKLEFCGGNRKVWWASYRKGADGFEILSSGSGYLDKDNLTWSSTIADPGCTGAWYYGRNDVGIPSTIATSDQFDAFGSNKLGWSAAGSACF